VKNNCRGFTVIEIVTVIVVLGILGAFTLAFLNHATNTYVIGNKGTALYQEASFIMERVSRELRDAQSMCIPFFGCTPVNDSGDLDNLYFQKRHSDGFDANNQIWYRVASGNLYRVSYNSSLSNFRLNDLMGRNITRFNIQRINSGSGSCNDRIRIDLTLKDGDQSITLTTAVSPKNLGTSYADRCFNGDYEDVIRQ